MIRSFLGIACPLTSSMRGFYRYLDQYGDSGLRLVSEFNLHITLRFLGSVEEHRLITLTEALRAQPLSSGEFNVDLYGLGFFTNSMWLGVGPSNELCDLVDGLTPILTKQGFAIERRRYHPHVTVARFRKDARIKYSRLQNTYAGAEWGAIPVRGFQLYKSETLPDGARYTVLDSFSLYRS